MTAKAAPEDAGDTWAWTAIDNDSKLIVSYMVGSRDSEYAPKSMDDLRTRLANPVQLTADMATKHIWKPLEGTFGARVDYAQLTKMYGGGTGSKGCEKKYSPAKRQIQSDALPGRGFA